eukprot:31032-Pelagococcus_subviridis.AAC.20
MEKKRRFSLCQLDGTPRGRSRLLPPRSASVSRNAESRLAQRVFLSPSTNERARRCTLRELTTPGDSDHKVQKRGKEAGRMRVRRDALTSARESAARTKAVEKARARR